MSEPQTASYDTDSPQFWESCYQQGRIPWDYGNITPPLKSFLESPYKMPLGKIGVLGCGTGYDACYLAQWGYEVTGIDYAPSAVNATHQKFIQAGVAGKNGYLLQRDFFELHEYKGYFDCLYEHTTFCSIHPANRNRYKFAVRDLLKPGGKLLGIWYVGDRQSTGLPYSITKSELFDLFDGSFSFDIVFEPPDSHPKDKGKEVLTYMTKL